MIIDKLKNTMVNQLGWAITEMDQSITHCDANQQSVWLAHSKSSREKGLLN